MALDITVGQVSGIIAAAAVIIQFLFPNALVLVLVCLLGKQHSAVTYSVTARQIHSSLWPAILRSDAAAGHEVYVPVRSLALLRPLGLMLIALAAVITPLGLYDAVLPESQMQSMSFVHLADSSALGLGTPAQGPDVVINRECGGFGGYSACPGSYNNIETITEDGFTTSLEFDDTYNITIPPSQRELYSGGVKRFAKSVSGFFDIRSRQYAWRVKRGKNNDKPFPVDMWRNLKTLVLDEKLEAVEGLVVDMVDGGIGFRNHSIPRSVGQAAEWEEDLLWMEPLTSCVPTNLTLEFTIAGQPSAAATSMQNISIIDDGGFANLIQEYPALAMDDNQNNPKLQQRAYKAAWLANVYAALIFNVTRPSPDAFGYLNSYVGKKFPLVDGSVAGASPNGIYVDSSYASLANPFKNVYSVTNSSFSNTTYTSGIYKNPFDITSENFSTISLLCSGSGQADYANSSNIQVQCGLFYAAARRVDGKDSLVLEANTTYHQSVYSCASLNKVSLKTVGFRYNATLGSDLSALTVLNITDKSYARDKDMPLWGIEQPEEPFRISDINQLWGLVSDDFDATQAAKNNISLKRAEELYLPGYIWPNSGSNTLGGFEYNPAGGLPKNILGSAYQIGSSGFSDLPDYTGATNLAMSRRWNYLSKNITDVPTILNLVWTDVAAQTLQGSKGWDHDESTALNKREETSNGQPLVPVLLYRRKVQYHWLYAIPALVACAVSGLVLLASVILSVARRGPAQIRQHLNHLSAGRLLAAQHYPSVGDKNAPTKVWIDSVGKNMIDLSHPPVFAGQVYRHTDDKPPRSTTTEVPDSYPLTPLSVRTHQGYAKMGA